MGKSEVDILLVEDNPDDLDLTLIALRKGKVANHVHVARDGEEALDFLFCRGAHSDRSFDSAPKVILLDLKLPKLTGLEVLREIRAEPRTRLLPVVVLTSSNQQRDLLESYNLGVNSYIQKPVDFNQFQKVIQELGFYWLVVNLSPPPQPPQPPG